MPEVTTTISRDRVGVLIGQDGQVKECIESDLRVVLNVDSDSGIVTIRAKDADVDPLAVLRAKDVVTAIARGFPPEKAIRLFDEDIVLDILNLRELFGKSESDIQRVKGRIIGRDGKARRIVEEITQADLSIYGHTVSIIGNYDAASLAREGLEMLIKGRQHATVYQHLKNRRREIKRKEKVELWEKPPEGAKR
jgi:ribosomal RNA assembly protein